MARKLPPRFRHGLLSVYAVVSGPRTWRSLKLAVDTGATYTMLPPDLLMDVGYDPTRTRQRMELSTANGLVLVPLLRVHQLKCLGLTVKDVEVVAHHLPPESPVEGLLGLDVLVHFKPFQAFYHAVQSLAASCIPQ